MWANCLVDQNGKPTSDSNIGIATVGCIVPFLQNLISAAFTFVGVVAVIIIILGGIKYTRSRGDPQSLKSAQQTLTWGIVGLVIVIFAFFVVTFIGTITGTNKSCLFMGVLNGDLNCR